MGPDELVRVQVGGIAGEGLDVQPRTPGEQGANVGTFVNAAAVPEDDDVAAKLAEQGTQEPRDLHMGCSLDRNGCRARSAGAGRSRSRPRSPRLCRGDTDVE